MKEERKALSLEDLRAELSPWWAPSSPSPLNFIGVPSTSSTTSLELSSFSSISSKSWTATLACRFASLVFFDIFCETTTELRFFLKTLSLCWTHAASNIACSSSARDASLDVLWLLVLFREIRFYWRSFSFLMSFALRQPSLMICCM